MRKLSLAVFMLFLASFAAAQQTVLTVPSSEVLDQNKAAVRLDTAWAPEFNQFSAAPNFILGLGHNFEGGLNLESFSNPDVFTTSIVPSVKYRYDGFISHGEGIALTFGDKVYIPVHNRGYDAGNFLYSTATLIVDGGLKIGAGIYNQENAFQLHNHTGALLTFEKTVFSKGPRSVTAVADWQSGSGSNGMVSFGAQVNMSKRFFFIPAYQVGNYNASHGNHGAALYIGYSLN
jgi:hypothetical protein